MEFLIFGASGRGSEVYKFIIKNVPSVKIAGFLDNKPKGGFFHDLVVWRPEEVDLKSKKILIASQFYDEINAQLISYGLRQNIDYFDSELFYFAKIHEDISEEKINMFNHIHVDHEKITRQKLSEKKRSDKLFVLGSGESITRLTDANIQEINENDSWGVNFWCLHKLIPTFYATEFCLLKEIDIFQGVINNVKMRENYSIDFIKNLENIEESSQYNEILKGLGIVPWIQEARLCLLNEERVVSAFELIKYLNLLERFDKIGIFLLAVTSVTIPLFQAIHMGYKEVILCGIDLKKAGYFYSDKKNIIAPDKMYVPPLQDKPDTEHHLMFLDSERIGADRFIELFVKHIAEYYGVKVYLGTTPSALETFLEQYDWS